MTRIVSWFSRGAASAVATRKAIDTYGDRVIVACIGLTTEHPDSARFADDCEEWFGVPITYLHSDRYRDTWAVWEGERFIAGPQGAPCTGILKKEVRFKFQQPGDLQVFGYTSDEAKRLDRFRNGDPTINVWAPLVDQGITKADCLAIVQSAGIQLPAMYRLGYANNNCLGCPKGGMGYWNAIRVDFPEVFDRMARLEREIGHAVLAEEVGGGDRTKVPVYLDELDPKRGRFKRDQPEDCSFTCGGTE